MTQLIYSLAVMAQVTAAFPWVANMPGVDSSLLGRRPAPMKRQSDQATCPFNTNHQGAAPYSSKYPYTGAQNGLAGTQKGGILVPAKGDTAHAFTAPGANDIRGPCPGLNAAANHNFLSHDGITTFVELVDAQQNLYNVGYDLAVSLATLGVALDGDVITEKLSIGCDATSRTSATGDLLGDELGLNGHNKFEGDTSLTRDDYYLTGDDHSFNGTLFGYMDATCHGTFNRAGLALYRSQRYAQSKAENGNFYYGPKSLLLYGAASFLYELFPSLGPAGTPDLATIASFFGAVADGHGGWAHVPEQIPPNWYNRVSAYTNLDVGTEILAQYLAYPVLFGGNAGLGNFDALGAFGGAISGGKLTGNAAAVKCLLYQFATEDVPSSLSGVLALPVEVVAWAAGKLGPVFAGSGCPVVG
ncbi:hypothetical protein MMC32_004353 [Xylographa parallela]|nr:hypothetical protein [Xylographa parallela]